MRISVLFFLFWFGFGLIILGMVSNGSSADQNFGSSVAIDLVVAVKMAPLYEHINATYKITGHDDGEVSWSFSKKGKSDTGLIYSNGKIVVGSQDKFDPTVGDRMEGELKTAIELLNSTQRVDKDHKLKALENVSYYSGQQLVDAMTWNFGGNTLVRSGRYNKSLFYYNKAIKADPSLPDPWNNRGVALRNLGRYKDAINSYDQALNLSPDSRIVWNGKGESLYRLGRISQALECFNRSIQLDSGNAQAWHNKGVILLRKRKYDAAVDCFNRSIASDPYVPEVWNNKGVALARLGRNDSALSCFNNAATLNPKFAGDWANAGIVLHSLGLENKSQNAFSVAKALGYNKTTAYFEASTLPPALVDVQKSPGFSEGLALLGLVCVSLLRRRLIRKP